MRIGTPGPSYRCHASPQPARHQAPPCVAPDTGASAKGRRTVGPACALKQAWYAPPLTRSARSGEAAWLGRRFSRRGALRRGPIAERDRIGRAVHADSCRIAPDRDDDCIADHGRRLRVAPLSGSGRPVTPEQRQALPDSNSRNAPLIDHHQAARHAQHLTGIGKQNPGGFVEHRNTGRISSAYRFRTERGQKVAFPELVAGVDDNRDCPGPRPEDRPSPGELQPAQAGVSEDVPERPQGFPQLVHGLSMAGRVVILKTNGEDSGHLKRLVTESGKFDLPEGGEMSEQDERDRIVRRDGEEESDDVEAHRKKAMTDEPRSDEESGEDFEAHIKKA